MLLNIRSVWNQWNVYFNLNARLFYDELGFNAEFCSLQCSQRRNATFNELNVRQFVCWNVAEVIQLKNLVLARGTKGHISLRKSQQRNEVFVYFCSQTVN